MEQKIKVASFNNLMTENNAIDDEIFKLLSVAEGINVGETKVNDEKKEDKIQSVDVIRNVDRDALEKNMNDIIMNKLNNMDEEEETN